MRVRPVLSAGLVCLASACGAASPVTLTPTGQTVDTSKAPPPPGSRYLGPVEVSNGSGCGLFAVPGSYDGALAELRNTAGQLGGNYVQIEAVTEPHDDNGCTTRAFAIRGTLFDTLPGTAKMAPIAPFAPPSSAASPAVPATPATPEPGACDPPCSPGFACRGGACAPQCNPPCEAGEVCSRRRTCEPVTPPAAPTASTPPVSSAPPASSTLPVLKLHP